MKFVGWDWASTSHDVTVLDDQGRVVERWAFSSRTPGRGPLGSGRGGGFAVAGTAHAGPRRDRDRLAP